MCSRGSHFKSVGAYKNVGTHVTFVTQKLGRRIHHNHWRTRPERTFCTCYIGEFGVPFRLNMTLHVHVLNLAFYLITRGFHRSFATGVACQQGTLIHPDTWDPSHFDVGVLKEHFVLVITLVYQSNLAPNQDLYYRNCLSIVFWCVSKECGIQTGDARSSGRLVLSHFMIWDLHVFYLLRQILFPS